MRHYVAGVATSLVLLTAGGALAQTKIHVGCTATSDCASAMVAVDKGIFKRYGLDVEMVLIGINSNVPAAILSNSIQIGGPTASVFLQAVDGGLDLVAIEGASVMDKNSSIAAFGRTGIKVMEPRDFIGKKVGVPGLGAFLDVLFRKWLIEKQVDPKRVNFVEVSFPTMNDILKSGAVDAVLTAEPYISRMTTAGTGQVGARYVAELASTAPIIFYAASREWAESHSDVIKRFRAGIVESAKIVNSDRDETSVAISRFNKQPLDLVKMAPPSHSEPELTSEQLAWWIDIMKQQNMLQTDIDLDTLILK